MIRWILYLPLVLLSTVFCYLTNFIVVLFCDEQGELPKPFLSLWETWDNSCNPQEITEYFPHWLSDWWDKHYTEAKVQPPEYQALGLTRWITLCHNANFSICERIKRYICRVLWLTRNNANGWAMFVFGEYSNNEDLVEDGHWVYQRNVPKKYGVWAYKNSDEWFSVWRIHVYFNIYLGYKLDMSKCCLCMYAFRPFAIKFKLI